jgi:hypothetical protein
MQFPFLRVGRSIAFGPHRPTHRYLPSSIDHFPHSSHALSQLPLLQLAHSELHSTPLKAADFAKCLANRSNAGNMRLHPMLFCPSLHAGLLAVSGADVSAPHSFNHLLVIFVSVRSDDLTVRALNFEVDETRIPSAPQRLLRRESFVSQPPQLGS